MLTKLDALILCGGKGKRLGNLGKKIPKSLIKIDSTPFIKHIIKSLKYKLIDSINISGFYKFNLLKRTLNKFKFRNLNLFNDGNIEILERIKKQLIRSKSALIVCYGDEVADIDVYKLIRSHSRSKKILTITTMKYKSSFGFLIKDKNNFTFSEKPVLGNYNIGYMIFDYENINYIKRYNKLENYINHLCQLNLVNEFTHNKKHLTFNTIEDIRIAKNKLKNF